MWDLIVPVPDHCLSFYFSFKDIIASNNGYRIVNFCHEYDIYFMIINICFMSEEAMNEKYIFFSLHSMK